MTMPMPADPFPQISRVACRCTGETFEILVQDGRFLGKCTRCGLIAVNAVLAPGARAEQALGGDDVPVITRIEFPADPEAATRELGLPGPQGEEIWPRPLPAREERMGVAVRLVGGPKDWAGKTVRFPPTVENFFIGSSGIDVPGSGGGFGHDVPDAVKASPHYEESGVDEDGTKIFTWTGPDPA